MLNHEKGRRKEGRKKRKDGIGKSEESTAGRGKARLWRPNCR